MNTAVRDSNHAVRQSSLNKMADLLLRINTSHCIIRYTV